MFEIMFDDLKPEAQKEFLEYMGIDNPSEGNYDVVPIAEIDYNDDDEDEDEADEEICLKEDEYTNETDGCLLVDPDILYYVEPDSTVDVSFEANPNHHEIFRVRADKGPYGETILEPIDDEDDEENEDRKMPWERY